MILADTESRSRADLKVVGGRNYWQDESTECLCAVFWDTYSGDLELWERGGAPPRMLAGAPAVAAHNMMGFDRFAFERLGWPVGELVDTSELARANGLPGGLDALAGRWLGLAKDKAASRFTVGLSTVRRPSGKNNPGAIPPEVWSTYDSSTKRARGVLPVCGPAELARVSGYCVSDVEILAHGWDLLEPALEYEPDVRRVDRVVNDRGMAFDSDLARALLREDSRLADTTCSRVAVALGLSAERVREIAGAPEQFADFTGLPNAQKETIESAVQAGTLSRDAAAMCSARAALASIASGKLQAGLARVSPDGNLRDMLRYIGAHTWRWSHRGMQTGNIPRPAKRFESWGDAEICELATFAVHGLELDAEEIDLLLRATLTAAPGMTLVVEDFSGVEARCAAWIADDYKAIEVLTNPKRNEYKETAHAIFGCGTDIGKGDPRYTAGKVSVLACGYGGGVNALVKMARAYNFSFEDAGVDPAVVVAAWRKLHAPIVRLWYALEAAFTAAVQGRAGRVDCFDFVPSSDGKDVAVFLPSGRPIVYNNTRLLRGDRGRVQISYDGYKERYVDATKTLKEPLREYLYGGKILENLDQAVCRDLMADALVRAEAAGLQPVLTVHDEIVGQVPRNAAKEGSAELHRIMCELPEWAGGFPIGAAGHFGERYRK